MNNRKTTYTLEATDLEKIFIEIFDEFPYELCKTNSPEVLHDGWDCDIAKENFDATMKHFEKNEKKIFYWNEFKNKILSLSWVVEYESEYDTHSFNHKYNAEDFMKRIENFHLEDLIPDNIIKEGLFDPTYNLPERIIFEI
jgi:hypothetical protein